MKYIVSLLVFFSFANGDHVIKKSLACPSTILIKNAPRTVGESGLDITFYSIANNCLVLTKKDKIRAIDYVAGSKVKFQAIIHENTGQKLYVVKANMLIEQSGTKNIFKF